MFAQISTPSDPIVKVEILCNYPPPQVSLLCGLCLVLLQPGLLALVEECRGLALIAREIHSVALCHKEPARRIYAK